jgi:hypothetical protein
LVGNLIAHGAYRVISRDTFNKHKTLNARAAMWPASRGQCYKRFTIPTVVKKHWIKVKNRQHQAFDRVRENP